jgi:hypothetical protein
MGRLQAIAREQGVADRVVFVGRRERDVLKYYYSAADIFITTPWYEPFGITPLEAMACGTPVIGAYVGGIKVTVRDGETGYLVPANDPAAVAERVAHLYRYPQLLRALSARAIQRANDCFSWANVARAIARLYEDLLVPRRRRVARELTTSTLFSERLVPFVVQEDADGARADRERPRGRRAPGPAAGLAIEVDEHIADGRSEPHTGDAPDDFELTA